jgi:hypothetical protein
MELAYADAFEVPIFVLLHQMTFKVLKAEEKGVPPLLIETQCNPSPEWKVVVAEIRRELKRRERTQP